MSLLLEPATGHGLPNVAGDHPDVSLLLEAATGVKTDGSDFPSPATTAWVERLGERHIRYHPSDIIH